MTKGVEIDTSNVVAGLKRLASVTGRPEAAMRILGQSILDDLVLESFHKGRSPDGKPWAPLKPATLRARRRRGKWGTRTLVETGELRNSFHYQVTDDGTTLRVGSPLRYAIYHQGDKDLPRRVLPERAMLPKPNKAGKFRGHVASKVINQALKDAFNELAPAAMKKKSA